MQNITNPTNSDSKNALENLSVTDSLIGHAWAAKLLQRSIDRGKLSHAYVFNGPRGVGKTRLAFDFAMAINCLQPPVQGDGLRYCSECRACRLIAEDKHSDVTLINLEWQAREEDVKELTTGGMVLKIDTIRAIQAGISRSPKEINWRMYIVQDAATMQVAAANAFLKTLEEPPPRAILILLNDSDRTLLPTIVSRCQLFELRAVPYVIIEQALRERGADASMAQTLAALAAGRPGWAVRAWVEPQRQELLDDRDEALMHLTELFGADRVRRLAFADEINSRWQGGPEKRLAVFALLNQWLGWWRDLALTRAGLTKNGYITNRDKSDELQRQAASLSPLQIKAMLQALTRAQAELEANVTPRLVLGNLLLNKLPKIV